MTEPVEESPIQAPDPRLTWVRRLIWVVLAVGIVAFLVKGANNPADPSLVPQETGAEAAAPPGAAGTQEPEAKVPTTTVSNAPASTVANNAPLAPTTAPAPGPPTTATPPTSAAPAPAPVPPTSALAASPRRPLSGFDEVAFRIAEPGNRVTDGAALLADDGASRRQGLMEQTDLRGYDAMIFRFPSPSTGRFFMRNTLIPLSIAFFDEGGRFVSSTDMEPCPDEVEDCPTHGADGPYVHAIEVTQGGLSGIGIGPGSFLSFPPQ